MGFEGLLGNHRLRENLSRSIHRGHISHFYLLSGPEGAGKKTLARLLCAALLCKSEEKPCLTCSACRKVMADTHPDVITVDDPEKKTVPVELVRKAREDMYIRPNEADRKIYIFPRAQDMMDPSQNALLKILEEPPSYGVFLLLTDNPEKLLATVRSRCTELALQPLPEDLLKQALRTSFPNADPQDLQAAAERSSGYLGQAKSLLETGCIVSDQTRAFAKAYMTGDALGLLQVLVPMEKWKRDVLCQELFQWQSLLQSGLMHRSSGRAVTALASEIGTARNARELLSAVGHLQKAIEYAQGNVSPAAVCGYLEWALR